jgi:hypothetical protein
MTNSLAVTTIVAQLLAGPTQSSGWITEPPIFPNRQLYLAQYRRVDVDRACPQNINP